MLENEKKFVITCDCGCCSGMEFRGFKDDVEDDDFVYASCLSGMFGTMQETWLSRAKDILRRMRSGCWFEAIVTKEDLTGLLEFLESVKCGNVPAKNTLMLTINAEDFDDGCRIYSISLDGKIPLRDLLLNKAYKAYEILIDEKARKALIEAIKVATAE